MFAKMGVNHVVSVQPFGCIANQVISKGVEKKMKDRFPHLNLLFLDFDAGTSEVNIFNRLYFMVKAAKEDVT
jgi:predicted nucleotide-binding protein (sugar kinase/HSP70/actin superfamily)